MVRQNIPQQQHTDTRDAADITSSYVLIDVRIYEEVISRGNSSEATRHKSNSSCSKRIIIHTTSRPPVLRLLGWRRSGDYCPDIEFMKGLYREIEVHCKSQDKGTILIHPSLIAPVDTILVLLEFLSHSCSHFTVQGRGKEVEAEHNAWWRIRQT